MKEYTIEEIHQAYYKAKNEGPSDKTRNICLNDLYYAEWYAYEIDQIARRDIKNALKSEYNLPYKYYITFVEQRAYWYHKEDSFNFNMLNELFMATSGNRDIKISCCEKYDIFPTNLLNIQLI